MYPYQEHIGYILIWSRGLKEFADENEPCMDFKGVIQKLR